MQLRLALAGNVGLEVTVALVEAVKIEVLLETEIGLELVGGGGSDVLSDAVVGNDGRSVGTDVLLAPPVCARVGLICADVLAPDVASIVAYIVTYVVDVLSSPDIPPREAAGSIVHSSSLLGIEAACSPPSAVVEDTSEYMSVVRFHPRSIFR